MQLLALHVILCFSGFSATRCRVARVSLLEMRCWCMLRSALGRTKPKASVYTVTVDLRDQINAEMKRKENNRAEAEH